jgi:putative membrane protein
MKIHTFALATLLAGALASCSGKQDSVDTAQNANEAKNEAVADNTAAPDSAADKMDFDSEFLTKAASGGMLEVELGKLVSQKATTAEAKQFAQQMVTDHTKANEELKALAAKKNITIPAALGNDHQEVYNDVADEKGVDLDKKYLKEMEEDHKEDVEEFTEASQKASDPDIKAFTTKTLPVLKMHYGMVQKMRPAVDARK